MLGLILLNYLETVCAVTYVSATPSPAERKQVVLTQLQYGNHKVPGYDMLTRNQAIDFSLGVSSYLPLVVDDACLSVHPA